MAVAYAFALVTGTAVLIAAFGAADGPQGQVSAQGGVQSPDAFLLASRKLPNDKRGY